MAQRIQLRRGAAAEWAAANPVLGLGEPGVETDTGKQKFGDGATPWNSRPYASKGDTGPVGPPNTDASLLATGTVPDGRLPAHLSDSQLTATYVPGNPTLAVTYNSDGSVASTTENGVLTTFTYNTDGTVNTQTRAGVTKTFTYDTNGNVTGAA